VILVGCDKTIPAAAMALARLNVPGLVLYGGSIAPGPWNGSEVTIQDVFEAVGAHAAGRITDKDLCRLEDSACPGAGACGGQFTANTMAIATEFLGIAALGSGSVPANDPAKAGVARQAGERVMSLVRSGLRPRDIITKDALENAIAAVATTGGSTNAVLRRSPSRASRTGAVAGGLRSNQRERAAARGSQTIRPFRCHGPAQGGRQHARGEAHGRGGDSARLGENGDRPFPWRRGGGSR
jgi:hypothetical protein